jgi:integrase
MPRKVTTFAQIAPLYLGQRQVSATYAGHVRAIAGRGGRLDSKALNSHLLRRVNEVSGITVRHERTVYLSLWRWAYDQGLCDEHPRGIAKLRARRKPTLAWTLADVQKILQGSDRYRGQVLWSGADKGIFLRAWVLLGYETGARRGDVFSFRVDQINGDTLSWTQSKTGDPLTRVLSPACLTASAAMAERSTDGTILGWVCSGRQALRHMATLLRGCGLAGTSKWLRRSSATHCEMRQAGAGRLHLGHRSPALFESAYCDWSQLRSRTPRPPDLVEG